MSRVCLKPAYLSLFLVMLVLTAASQLGAAATSWNGTNTNWNSGANWTNGVPGAGDTATIVGTAAVFPVLSGNVTIEGLTVKSGASLTLNSGTLAVGQTGFVVEGGGVFTQNSGTVQVQGPWSQGGVVNSNAGTVRFTGSSNIDLSAQSIVFSEDFNVAGTGWTFGGAFGAADWTRANPSSAPSDRGAPTSVWDGPAMSHRNGTTYRQQLSGLRFTSVSPSFSAHNGGEPNNYVISPPIARPTGANEISLEMRRWLAIEANANAQIQLIISSTTTPTIASLGTTWVPIWHDSNVTGGTANNDTFWKRSTFNITSALATIGNPATFHLIVNHGYAGSSSGLRRAGFYFDDVKISIPGNTSSYSSLEIATTGGATVRTNSALFVNGDLTVLAGARLDMGNFTHRITGNFDNQSGTIVVNDAILEFVGSGPSVVSGSGLAQAVEPSFIFDQTFDSGNGGFTTAHVLSETASANDALVWTFETNQGIGGSGAWRMAGYGTSSVNGTNRGAKELRSPNIAIGTGQVDLKFTYWHNYDLEQDWDHYYLQVSNNNGASWRFVDFEDFLLNSYSGFVGARSLSADGNFGAEAASHEAWTGTSLGWERVIVDIDSVLSRQGWAKPVNLRWRWFYEQDRLIANAGVRIDDVRIQGSSTTVIGNGVFEVTVNKDASNIPVTLTGDLEIINRVNVKVGNLIVANGSDEILIRGQNSNGSTGIVVESSGTLTIQSGSVFTGGNGNNVNGIFVESGGSVNVTGGLLHVGPRTSQSSTNTHSIVVEDGGSLNVSGGTLRISNNNAAVPDYNLSLSTGTLTQSGGTIDINGSLTFDGTATFIMTGGDVDVRKDFVVEATATVTASTGDINLQENLEVNGTYTHTGTGFLRMIGGVNAVIRSDNAVATTGNICIEKTGGAGVDLEDPLVVVGTYCQTSGDFDVTASNFDVSVSGDVAMTGGTFNKRDGTWILNGSTAQNVDFNNNFLEKLVFSGTGVKTLSGDLRIDERLSVNNGASVVVAGGVSVLLDDAPATTMDLSGSIRFLSNTTLLIGANSAVNVLSGGVFRAAGTDSGNAANRLTIRAEVAGANTYSINLAAGGTLALAGTSIADGVIDVTNNAAALMLSDVAFSSLPTGSTGFIDLNDFAAGALSLRNLSFTRGTRVAASVARNILANATTMRFTVGGYAGDLAGETFDGDTANKVLWVNNCIDASVTGASVTTLSSLWQGMDLLPNDGSNMTVRASYQGSVGSQTTIFPTFANHYGRLVVPAFNGTLVVAGYTFWVGSDGVAIDASAAGASASIQFHNCMFIDPDNTATNMILPGAATVSLSFCTIDDTNGSGATSVADSIFTRNIAASSFVDFDSRNLRLSKAGATTVGTVARHGTFTDDINGVTRPTSTNRGAHHYFGTLATTTAVNDMTGQTTANRTITFSALPAQNTVASIAYVTGSDGSTSYLSLINTATAAVALNVSWSGSLVSQVSWVQATGATDSFWIYAPFDSDGDGYFDSIRRFLHVKDGSNHTLSQAMTFTLRDKNNALIDFSSSGGWSGQLFIQNHFTHGVLNEFQVAMTTPASGGQIHTFFMNPSVTSPTTSGGLFFNGPDFATAVAGRAAESFFSNSDLVNFNLNPNPMTIPELRGTKSNGRIIVTRTVDGTNSAALIQLDRSSGQVVNTWTGPGNGESLATEPVIVHNTAGLRQAGFSNSTQVLQLETNTWSRIKTANIGLNGYGYVGGIAPFGWFVSNANFMVAFNETSCLGAVIATEYRFDQNGAGTAFEKLGTSYSDPKLRYNAGGVGGFVDGVAPVVGHPTGIAWNPLLKTMVVSTDAGLVYGWSVNGVYASDTTAPKGAMISGFPLLVPGGRITKMAFLSVSDPTLLGELEMSASGVALGIFNDLGQMVLVRVPVG